MRGASLRRLLIIGAALSIGGQPVGFVRTAPKVSIEPRREPYRHTPTQRWRRYPGQSPEAAQAAIASAEAKRERRVLRNKRLAGEVV
jgi:hypothetical protein